MQKKHSNITTLVQFSFLLAIEALFCFTPLGSLPAIGPMVATLGMIPVIITAIMLGTGAGAGMGFVAGLFSFIIWTFTPPNPLMAFIFTPFYSLGSMQGGIGSVLICFVPRIMVGVVTGVLYKIFSKKFPTKAWISFGVSAMAGSLANTLLVVGGIALFFGQQYAGLVGGLLLAALGSMVLFNGVPEAVVSFLVSVAVCRPLKKVLEKKGS